jgi:chromosome segregation ATPase
MNYTKQVLAVACIAPVACNDINKNLEQSIKTNESKQNDIEYQDTTVLSFVKAFNHVEEQLDSITMKQHSIVSLTNMGDINENQKRRIDDNISDINQLMLYNRKSLVLLARKIKSSNLKNVELLKSIDIINHQILIKDKELEDLNKELMFLNSELAQLRTKVNFLVTENDQQATTIREKISENQTAYYIIDSETRLEKQKVIDVNPGLFGLNKSVSIHTQIENGMFNMIDYTLVTVIPIEANHIQIVTIHPPDSYTIFKDATAKHKISSLIITNPEKFWSTSKHLVILNDH